MTPIQPSIEAGTNVIVKQEESTATSDDSSSIQGPSNQPVIVKVEASRLEIWEEDHKAAAALKQLTAQQEEELEKTRAQLKMTAEKLEKEVGYKKSVDELQAQAAVLQQQLADYAQQRQQLEDGDTNQSQQQETSDRASQEKSDAHVSRNLRSRKK